MADRERLNGGINIKSHAINDIKSFISKTSFKSHRANGFSNEDVKRISNGHIKVILFYFRYILIHYNYCNCNNFSLQHTAEHKKFDYNDPHRLKESFEHVPLHTACLTYLGFYLLMILGFLNQLFFTPKVATEKNRKVIMTTWKSIC